MEGICAPLSPGASFVRGVLAFVDCQAQSIGTQGYQALAMPGSTLSISLTVLLTLFVALFGYRMILGHTPAMREGILALAKIGIVLALATSWPAYRTLVYDVVLRGPAELASDIGRTAGIPGAGGGLVGRLDFADGAMVRLAILNANPGSRPPQPPSAPEVVPPFPGFDNFALGGARITFLMTTLGALASVRLIAGLLLALGPFFIAFLLFDSTRGLFEGWVRGLAATFLGALGTAMILGVEIALLEPWLFDAISRRSLGDALPTVPVELFVLTSVFALAMLATLYASARVALGFSLPQAWRAASERAVNVLRGAPAGLPAPASSVSVAAASGVRSRASAVADAVAANQRREFAVTAAIAGATHGTAVKANANNGPLSLPSPLGQSFPRRTATRVSSSAGARDGAS